MRMDKIHRSTGDKEALLSNVALLYYGEGLTQSEIAKRLKVSRATVVNMLRESRDLGIVDIRVEGRHLSGSTLSRDVREAFGLEDVYVAEKMQRALQSPKYAVGRLASGPGAESPLTYFQQCVRNYVPEE